MTTNKIRNGRNGTHFTVTLFHKAYKKKEKLRLTTLNDTIDTVFKNYVFQVKLEVTKIMRIKS